MRTVAVLLAAGSLLAPHPSTTVNINEVVPGRAGFVELRAADTTDISGWTIRSCAGTKVSTLATIPYGTVLAAGEFYLVTGEGFAGTADRQLTVAEVTGTGYALVGTNHLTIDAVDSTPGTPCRQGRPAPKCPTGSATARDAEGHDTGDNAADFSCRPPTPGQPNN